jgi:hypothetical protein
MVEAMKADVFRRTAQVLMRCPVESVSLLYLNPPYDWESGQSGNQLALFTSTSRRPRLFSPPRRKKSLQENFLAAIF